MYILLRSVFASLALFAGAGAWAGDPVAFLSDLRGEVALDGVGKPPLLADLLPGSKLTLGKSATAVVMFVVSGDEYSLKGAGEFSVGREGVSANVGAMPSKRSPPLKPGAKVIIEVSRASAASLRMRSAVGPRGEHSGPAYPVNARIATLQPTLRWNAEPDGGLYTIEVTGSDGREVYR